MCAIEIPIQIWISHLSSFHWNTHFIGISIRFGLCVCVFFLSIYLHIGRDKFTFTHVRIPSGSHSSYECVYNVRYSGFQEGKHPKALRSKLLDFYFLIKTEFIHKIWLCAFRIRCNSIVYIWIDVFQNPKTCAQININQRLQHFKMQYFDVDIFGLTCTKFTFSKHWNGNMFADICLSISFFYSVAVV